MKKLSLKNRFFGIYKKKSNSKNTVHQCNLDLLHLLFSIPEVEEIIFNLRNKYEIPKEGIEMGENLNKWNETILLSRWDEWDVDTRGIWDRCKKLQTDKRYIECIRRFISTNVITAPEYNFDITRDFEQGDDENPGKLGEFKIKIYRKLAKEEKKELFEQLDFLMEHMEPSMLKKSRPKHGIKEDLSILKNFEKMKATGNYSTINSKDGKFYPFESTKIAKDRNEKTYQRRMEEIEERIGWDASSSN